MKNNILTIFVAIFIIGVLSMFGVYAYNGNQDMNLVNYNSNVHDALEQAIENNDYDAWIKVRQDNNLPMNGKMFQVINKANFAKYKELHDANLAGDFEKADKARSDLGLNYGIMNKRNGQGCGGITGTHNCQGNVDADSNNENHTACSNYALHHGLN